MLIRAAAAVTYLAKPTFLTNAVPHLLTMLLLPHSGIQPRAIISRDSKLLSGNTVPHKTLVTWQVN
jgi:hypothetical protein